ncbi:hypothetical protein C0J52_17668 [Blattella germanica]|nr:hypothetical protein C0J52_17668 [Blattella germanica]
MIRKISRGRNTMTTKLVALSLLISLTFLNVATQATEQNDNSRNWVITCTDTIDLSYEAPGRQLERAQYAYLSYNGTFYASNVTRNITLGDAYSDGWTLNFMNMSTIWYNYRREEYGSVALTALDAPNLNWEITWYMKPDVNVDYQLDAELIRQEPGDGTDINENLESDTISL